MTKELYRGKRVDNGEWVKGDLIKSKDKCYIHPQANVFQVSNSLSKLIVLHEVIPETVGQCIGLKERCLSVVVANDKNKKWIFEGDIVNCYGGEYCQGYWEYNKTVVANFYDYIAIMTISELEYIEVIGNKWDNPELLKGEEE